SPESNVNTPVTQFKRGSMLARPELGGTRSSKSWEYKTHANPSCFRLLRQAMPCALDLALVSAGRSMLARIAIIAMTTKSSMRVKAGDLVRACPHRRLSPQIGLAASTRPRPRAVATQSRGRPRRLSRRDLLV